MVRTAAEGPVYAVGGSVRDALLGREISDLDLACLEPAQVLAGKIAAKTGGTLVVLDDATRVYRIVLPDRKGQIDVAQVQGRSIEEDLQRRDFTINAMALPLSTPGALLDPRGGRADLRRKLLRVDIPKVLDEDPARLLRAFRIAAQLGLTLDARTMGHLRSRRRRVGAPAGERIREELMRLLAADPSHVWLRLMDRAKILTALFPELEASRRCAQVYYGAGGVLRHTLDAVERMDGLLAGLDCVFPDLTKDIRRHFEPDGGIGARAPLLRLAVLLHDIAKPATARRIGGRLRFFHHDERGARMSERILKRLRFSNREIQTIDTCIRHHLRPGNLAANRIVSDKAAHRFFRDLGPDAVALLLVCWADHASYLPARELAKVVRYARENPHTFPERTIRGEAARKTLRHLQVLHYLLSAYFRRREKILPARLLDGNEVMKILKIPPGPAVGKILTRLQEAQADGKVQDREAAMRFIRKIRR